MRTDNFFLQLLGGYKFDLRLYSMVVLRDGEYEMYVCPEGLVRVCTEPYQSPTVKNLHKLLGHLTNSSLGAHTLPFSPFACTFVLLLSSLVPFFSSLVSLLYSCLLSSILFSCLLYTLVVQCSFRVSLTAYLAAVYNDHCAHCVLTVL